MTAFGWYQRRLLALLAVLAVTGCASRQPALPWPLDLACQPGFPAGSAASGLLQVEAGGATSSYFVGIDTRPSGTELQLVSLQGLPLYRLHCTGGSATSQSLATVESALDARSLAAYLLAMYSDTDVAGEGPPGWRLAAEPGGNFAWLGTEGRQVTVQRSGNPPWYQRLTLRDPGQDATLTFTIREVRDVVPE